MVRFDNYSSNLDYYTSFDTKIVSTFGLGLSKNVFVLFDLGYSSSYNYQKEYRTSTEFPDRLYPSGTEEKHSLSIFDFSE